MTEPMSASPKSSESIPDLTGRTVGRFVLRARLDSGHGMGEVYRADDTILKRSVAIKRISPKLRADEHYRQRFLKEAERASCLSDQHIAGIYDVLEEKDETYLVMEYVDGTTLRPRLQQPFPVEEFIPTAIQCARALQAAHEKDIIHGDIKPENIMLTTGGKIKILDFGVAKRLAPAGDADATPSIASQPATFSGTPAYMAPEVLLEKGSDKRSDIFSLGIVFYEMLAGRHPFRADSYMATIDRILHEIPKPVHQLNPQIPEQVGHVVSRMLAKDPAKRHLAASDLISDLKEMELKKSDAAAFPANLMRWFVSNKAATLALLIMVLLLIAAGPSLYRRIQDWIHPSHSDVNQSKWIMIADFNNLTGDEFFDRTVRELLSVGLEQSHFFMIFPRGRIAETLRLMQKPVNSLLDSTITREICLRENLQAFIIGQILPAGDGYKIVVKAIDPRNEETIVALTESLSGKQEFWQVVERISAKLREAMGEERTMVKRDSISLEDATTESLPALQRFSQALHLQAAGQIDEALALMKAAVELDPEFALAYSHMAIIQQALGVEEECLISSDRAFRLRNRVSERERYLIQANYHSLRLNFEEALEDLRSIALLYPNDPTAQSNLAPAFSLMNRLGEAIEAARLASRLDPANATIRGQLIELLAQAGRSDEALQEVGIARGMGADIRAIAVGEAAAWLMKGDAVRSREALQPLIKDESAYYENIGRIGLAQLAITEGKLDEAMEQLESDLGLSLEVSSEYYTAIRHYWLGRINALLGQKKNAIAHLDNVLKKTRLSPIRLHELRQVGLAYAELGELSRAQNALQQVEQLQSAFPSNFSRAAVYQLHGSLKLATGNQKEALQDLMQARALWDGVLVTWSLATYWEEQAEFAKALDCYREVIVRKGDVMQWDFPGIWVLAHLQAARCYQRLGKEKEALQLYSEFLKLWKTSRLPQTKQAKQEASRLRSE
jgi:eukaryotic-like serine/threonine-protein kinase